MSTTKPSVNLDALTAISPLDGRYWAQLNTLSQYFSEYALISYRVQVEIEYFIALCELPLPQLKDFDNKLFPVLRNWYACFSLQDATKIKETEKVTNHDVKAVEYWIKDKMIEAKIDNKFIEFIHFALTSQDVNNTSIPLSLIDALKKSYYPKLDAFIETLSNNAKQWMDVPMLARTHGQPATPTRVGKELMVFVERLQKQYKQLKQVSITAKFGGATGGLNAHYVAYPNVDWPAFADKFCAKLGLEREQYTTQISHYDNIGSMCDAIKRINTILIDFARDMWTYISLEYFKLKIVENEIGSSAMPHKVNPIDFENAEGNLGLANAILEHLSVKLPISRLQRDLTDSTVLRNVGVPFAHSILSISSLSRGFGKLLLNKDVILKDLEDNWIVVSEAIQTVLRREGYPKPYEAVKKLTRTGSKITTELFEEFINSLDGISDAVKVELKQITPFNYIGVVPKSS